MGYKEPCRAAPFQGSRHTPAPFPLLVHTSCVPVGEQQLSSSTVSQPWDLVGTHCSGRAGGCALSDWAASLVPEANPPLHAQSGQPAPLVGQRCPQGGLHPARLSRVLLATHLLASAAAQRLSARAVQRRQVHIRVAFAAVCLCLAGGSLLAAGGLNPAAGGKAGQSSANKVQQLLPSAYTS